jgi:DNA-directed RNA polymerase subunit RPC12/RpoP
MGNYECDACGEEFDRLTRLRLHECDEGGADETPGPDLNTESVGDGGGDRPWEVKQGLEPEYDCPECGYYKTGLTVGPHAFLNHLQDEHGYSKSEASDVLHNG